METNSAVRISRSASPTFDRVVSRGSAVAVVAVLFTGAIFGFFYAWVCSTMWGLDAADPRVAIPAMQAMNASVRNPAFFLTPVIQVCAAALLRFEGRRTPAALFGIAAATYTCGALLLTLTVNVPMNEALALQPVPPDLATAERVWDEYSSRWQTFNLIRTAISGLALAMTATALVALPPRVASPGSTAR